MNSKSETQVQRFVFEIDMSQEAIDARAGMPGPLDDDWRTHMAQQNAFMEAKRGISLPYEKNDPAPSVAECQAYIASLNSIETRLLPKRDQLLLKLLQVRAARAMVDTSQAMFYLSQAELLAGIPAKDFPYAQIGYVQVLSARNESDFYLKEDDRDLFEIYQQLAEAWLRGGDESRARSTLEQGETVMRGFGFAVEHDEWYSILNVLEEEKAEQELHQSVIEHIRSKPSCKQTDLYTDLAHLAERDHLSSICYYLAKDGLINRVQSGRTYALTVT